jgi:hypothetical protein
MSPPELLDYVPFSDFHNAVVFLRSAGRILPSKD